jgi:Protein of unknown function (DUF3175)
MWRAQSLPRPPPGYNPRLKEIRAQLQHCAKQGSMRKKARKSPRTRRSKTRRWSGEVTKYSDALDLERDVFKSKDPHKIALSLKRSAEHSKRRKGTPYQSAMSMLNFYINRAGKNLPKKQKRVLERAKDELRKAFGRK